jgi:hypothetical protein
MKSKLPELTLEAAFVVFAVLLALGVDEWRENRTNQKLADRTRDSIIEEIHTNYLELISTRSLHDSLLIQLNNDLIDLKNDSSIPINVDFSVSLLSTAAWHTAQMTQATHFLDLSWIIEVSRLYELQELYEVRQNSLVALISDMDRNQSEDPHQLIISIISQLRTLTMLQDGLMEAYSKNRGRATNANPS